MSGSLYDDNAGECEECGTEAPKKQLEAYDGVCGACWHKKSEEESQDEQEIQVGSNDWKDAVNSKNVSG